MTVRWRLRIFSAEYTQNGLRDAGSQRDKCKNSRKHLLAALKFRKTSIGCEESIKAAIEAAPDDETAKYILEP